jgi:hypothetical protein
VKKRIVFIVGRIDRVLPTVRGKFEHCVKDHSENDSAARPCVTSSLAPFEECLTKRQHVVLIALDVHQVHGGVQYKGKAVENQ